MYHLLRNQSDNVVYKNIKLLRDENQFFDVTLICEDGVVVSAHKLVLASHSDRFKQILSQLTFSTSGSHHCVYLTGVTGQDLADVLEFMYVGEAKISQDRLVRFLGVAQQLHVNGLVDGSSSSSSSESTILSSLPEPNPQSSSSASFESPAKPVPHSPAKPPAQSPSSSPVSSLKRKLAEPELFIKNEFDELDLEDQNNFDDEHDPCGTESFDNNGTEDLYEDIDFETSGKQNKIEYDEDCNPYQRPDVHKSNHSKSVGKPRGRGRPPKILKIMKSPSKSPLMPKENIATKPSTNDESAQVLLENLKSLGLSKLSKLEINNSKSKKIVRDIMSTPTAKLPAPIALMSDKQLLPWLKLEILKDIIEQGKRPVIQIKWGDESCHPSFWPDDIWPWHLVTNISHSQKHRPEGVRPFETWKIAATNRLRQKNIDPDSFISEDYTEEEDIRKKKCRGISTKTSC